MDWFDLILPRDAARRAAVLDPFFDELAGEYEATIERERNIENIERLLDLVIGEARPTARPLLDFGCGSGLAQLLARDRGIELIGFEPARGMACLAKERGVSIIDADSLRALPPASLGGAFASYVFHLAPEPELLAAIPRALAPGAVLAANLHKGIGLERFSRYLERCGLRVTRQVPSAEHGVYVVCEP